MFITLNNVLGLKKKLFVDYTLNITNYCCRTVIFIINSSVYYLKNNLR